MKTLGNIYSHTFPLAAARPFSLQREAEFVLPLCNVTLTLGHQVQMETLLVLLRRDKRNKKNTHTQNKREAGATRTSHSKGGDEMKRTGGTRGSTPAFTHTHARTHVRRHTCAARFAHLGSAELP